VSVWGTARLDGKAARRFAALDVALGADDRPLPDAAHDAAYLLEQAPGRYWMVTYWWFMAGPEIELEETSSPSAPPWVVLDDTVLHHAHLHNHGKQRVSIGFRGGRLVYIHAEDYNSRREPESEVDDHRDDATCAKRCPLLSKLAIGTPMMVQGPAARLEDLPEPPPIN